MEDGTYLKSNTGAWLPVVQSSGYYVARHSLDSIDAPLLDDEYLGAWTDPSTGTLYLDATEHIESRSQAMAAAEKRGELAIWDIRASEEVLTSHGIKARELAA